VLPAGLGAIGQLEKLIQICVRHSLGIEPRTGDATQLDLHLDDHPCQPQATNRSFKPVLTQVWSTIEDVTVRANKPDALNMITERAEDMMVLAMHVVGNGASDGHHLGSGGYRQNPAARDHETLDVPEQNAGLAGKAAGVVVKRDEVIKPSGRPQLPSRIEADIAVASSGAIGNSRI